MFNFDGDILENLGYAKVHMIDLNDFKKEVQKKYTDACRAARDMKLHAKKPGYFDQHEAVKYAMHLSVIHECEWIADQLDFELDVPEPDHDEALIVIKNIIETLLRDNEKELSTLQNAGTERRWCLHPSNHERMISRCEGVRFAFKTVLGLLNAFITYEDTKKNGDKDD